VPHVGEPPHILALDSAYPGGVVRLPVFRENVVDSDVVHNIGIELPVAEKSR